MDEREARQWALALMETADAAYLTTMDRHGFPQTRAMLNLRNKRQWPTLTEVFQGHEEDFLLYFSTNTSSAKMAQIRANPKVSAYFCNPAAFHGLMLAGTIELVTDQACKRRIWQDGWERYYPRGVNDPDYTLLCLLPTVAKGWHGQGPLGFDL